MEPLMQSVLIDFDQTNTTQEQKKYQNQVFSAIKLNMNDLQNYDVIDKFTQCSKCRHILTQKDKDYVFKPEEVNSNPKDFLTQTVQQLRQNKFTKVLWICGFCAHNNIISNVDIRFAKNKARVIQREKMTQRKDPIMLIVFDTSGSMEEVIQDSQNKNWTHLQKQLQKIKQTKIYKKIVADEQKQLEELLKQQNPGSNLSTISKDPKMKYVDFLKKNKLLMGLTQYLITKLNPSKRSTTAHQQMAKKINDFVNNDKSKQKKMQSAKNKTIGFMFFNSNVMICVDQNKDKIKKVLLVDTNEQYKPKLDGFEREIVDFDSFEGLFKIGQKYGGDITNKMNNFQFQNLDVKSMSNYLQGQTALGPAIVTALGVVSKHGQGSSIVVVTDGIGNKGIFDQTQPWDENYKLLKMRLQKLKCFMTILQCRKSQKGKKQQELVTGLDRFCIRHNDSVVKKINVILNQNDNKSFNNQANSNNIFDDVQKKMKAGIDRQNTLFSNQVLIKCQHPAVNYSKCTQNLKGKLFNLKQVSHISPDFNAEKLNQRDYLHHFMTQIVIKYQNTQTGEQSIFMSYIIQKFIKYSKMRTKDLKSLDNQGTFLNIIQYLNSEQQQFNLDNLPLGIIRQTFRKTICMTPIGQKTLRFDLNNSNGKNSEWMENMRKYQDQALLNEAKKKVKTKSKKPQTTKKTEQKSLFGSKIQEPKQMIQMQQKQIIQEEDSEDQFMRL